MENKGQNSMTCWLIFGCKLDYWIIQCQKKDTADVVKIHNGIAVIHGYVISYYTTTSVESIGFTGALFPR